jgi:ribonuclease HI
MGFRDLQLFNQSMLAKQGWRLISNPDSLCGRVLKGKYFHNTDFMAAKKKRNASHIWNAILYGREALQKGLIKRVGDGSSIRVWDDPWIPGNPNMKPLYRDPEAEVTMVSEFINEEQGCWDKKKLEENIIGPDVATVTAIPIGRFTEDYWAWTQEKSGTFSVRSCYRLLSASRRMIDVSSSHGAALPIWKKLWRLDVPPKVRTFWWRVINEFVPCRQILHRRHMEELPQCKTCGAAQESVMHAFFECTWARLFWQELKSVTSIKIPAFHPRSWASDIVEEKLVTKEQACVILCGCWSIWTERNAIWHGGGGRSVSESVRWVMDTIFDLAQLGKKQANKEAKPKPQWTRPRVGTLKINVDACFKEDLRQGSTGLVIRDHDGRLIQGQALWYESAGGAMIMEALALRDGVRLAIDRSYQHVEVETDAQEVLKLLEDTGGGRSEIASICQEIKELSEFFNSLNFRYIGRLGNEAAHKCAKIASFDRRRCVWINYTPPFLVDILAKDCNPTI